MNSHVPIVIDRDVAVYFFLSEIIIQIGLISIQTSQQWSSKIGFILSAAGSAIGVGAIWKLPYVTGVSGGGAFFLLFILFSLFIGFPFLLAEFIIGRSTQKEAVSAYRSLAPNTKWHWIGKLGVFTCFLLLSFYSVIGGWIVIYFIKGMFGGIITDSADYANVFNETIGNPLLVMGAQFAFLAFTVLVVAKGIQNGIEKASKILMPALFILFFVLIVRSLTLDNAMEGVKFFLAPDFSNITSESVLFAMGQAFFSLSIGVSVMVTYSSYLSKKESLIQPAISIVSMNLFIALLAGLAIFPAVFSLGLEPDEGPGLLFVVLPAVFNQIIFGEAFLLGFLALFLFATLTSAFSMLEIIVASLVKGKEEQRTKYAYIVGVLIFAVGVPSALSYSVFSDITFFSKSIFDSADYLVSNILMPLGVFLISIFVPRKIAKSKLREELLQHSRLGATTFNIWFFIMKYIIPFVIIIVFLDITGVLDKIIALF